MVRVTYLLVSVVRWTTPRSQQRAAAALVSRSDAASGARAHGREMASEFLGLVRSAHCAWPSRGIEVDMQLLPLTAHPVLSPNSAVLSGTSQADFLLAALGTKGVQGSLLII